MTTRLLAPPAPPATDDYTYEMQVHVPDARRSSRP